MPTIRLVPSAYTRSSTSRVTVTDEANMYNNTDHTESYASIRGRNSTSNTYYAFIHGFNFDDIPSNATINSFSVKIKAYRNSYQSTGSSYRLRLASTPSSSNAISNTTLSSDLSTSTDGTVYTFPNGSLTWNQIVGYGSNFSIEIPLRPSSSNYPYVYVYGAEILLDVTVPMHDILITNNSSSVTTSPSSSQSVVEHTDQTVSFYNISSLNNVIITDNSNDIKNSLVHYNAGTSNSSLLPSELIDSNGTVTNPNNGLTDHTSTTYAQTNGQSTHFLMYKFNVPEIPSIATNISVSCTAKVAHTRQTTSGQVQLYSGTIAKGSASTFNSTVTTVNLNVGTWTAEELNDVRIRIGNSYTGGTTTYYTRFYGATLTVSYTIAEEVYIYTISNISTDHTIVISDVSSAKAYFKVNGNWTQASKVYKKVSGNWIEQSDFSSLFSGSDIWIKKE